MYVRNLIVPTSFILVTLAILLNSAIVQLPLLGTTLSVLYIGFVGFLFGRTFLFNEDESFAKVILGICILVCLLILVGTPIVTFYEFNLLGLAIVLFAPLVLLAVTMGRLKWGLKNKEGRSERVNRASYFSPVYIIYLALVAYSLYLLVNARSGWVYGTVWDVVSTFFFVAYFLAAFVLFGIILYSRTRTASKILLIIVYSMLSCVVFATVLYPGNFGDPSDHLGWARLIFNYGNLRKAPEFLDLSLFSVYLSVKEKALALLAATIAKMFVIDVYWIHTFITPVLWGFFVPLTTYKIAKVISGKESVSVLAAFLSTSYSGFVRWGSRSTGNSFGFVLFFVSFYFSLRYLKYKESTVLLLSTITAVTSLFAHFLTGILSFMFLFLAITLKLYETTELKRPRTGFFIVFVSFLSCVITIPAFFGLNNILYLNFAPPHISSAYAQREVITFSVEKLLGTDIWAVIFGEYVDFSFNDIILSGIILFLGVAGLAYALKLKNRFGSTLNLFMLLSLMTVMINYRMLQYAMVNVLFGPRRLWAARDFLAIPYAAIIIMCLIQFLQGEASKKPASLLLKFRRWVFRISTRSILVAALVALSLSAFAASSMYKGYEWLGGLQPTELELDAVKYIDEHTDGGYVVVTMPDITQIGYGFVGRHNSEKYYVYSWDLGKHPSISSIQIYMSRVGASVGYFVASSFRTPNFDNTVAEALKIFGPGNPFKILSNENGAIYIFRYIPSLPSAFDVIAGYEHHEIPPSSYYYMQNNLVSVVFDLETETLEMRDSKSGELSESINLNETLVDGRYLGSMVSIEYDTSLNEIWTIWDPDPQKIIVTPQFGFRLGFENASLIGILEANTPYVQLRWEHANQSTLALGVGDFERLYIPGLVGGEDSYDVRSREFGLLYTLSLNSSITFHPAYNYEINSSSLTFNEIAHYCNLNITEGYLTYDLYVVNNAELGQWAYTEVWLPDVVYQGVFAPIYYSLDDGKTWYGPIAYSNEPIRTLSGTDVNWVFTRPAKATEEPVTWRVFTDANGGYPTTLPKNLTDSGGGQNRYLFGLYMPAKDEVLLRIGISIYYSRPLKITYVFRDSENIFYGLRNMEKNSIIFYNYGYDVSVGGLTLTTRPTALSVIQDETGKITSIFVTILGNSTVQLLSERGNTTVDTDNDGIPDVLEGW